MSKFEEYESMLLKQNKYFKTLILIILPLFISINAYWINYNQSYAFRASRVFNDTRLNLDVCIEGTKRILNKVPEELLLTKDLLTYLKANKFNDFNLEGATAKDFLRAELLNKNECRIIFKEFDGFSDHLVALKVLLREDTSFPFQFKVANYSEIILSENEVTKINKENI